jgi:hypothetical protein
MNSSKEEQFSLKGGEEYQFLNFFTKEHLLQNIHNRDI